MKSPDDPGVVLQPPVLKHDLMMAERFGSTVGPRGKLERRVVWNLLAHLERAGFYPYCVAGGDDGQEVATTAQAVMELVFNLDEACVGFVQGTDKKEAGNVVLVFGNDGWDSVSDWRWYENAKGKAFDRAMDAFNGEDYV